jgi:hypothetical protein
MRINIEETIDAKLNLELTAQGEGGERRRFSLRVDEVCLRPLFLGVASPTEALCR